MNRLRRFDLLVSLNLEKLQILLVGGGRVALEKLKTIYESGANVKVIAKDFSDEMIVFLRANKISYEEREVKKEDFETFKFAVVATRKEDALKINEFAGNCLVNDVPKTIPEELEIRNNFGYEKR